jgi:multisubunit Na+/H+ antiporter MnhC subunit
VGINEIGVIRQRKVRWRVFCIILAVVVGFGSSVMVMIVSVRGYQRNQNKSEEHNRAQ